MKMSIALLVVFMQAYSALACGQGNHLYTDYGGSHVRIIQQGVSYPGVPPDIARQVSSAQAGYQRIARGEQITRDCNASLDQYTKAFAVFNGDIGGSGWDGDKCIDEAEKYIQDAQAAHDFAFKYVDDDNRHTNGSPAHNSKMASKKSLAEARAKLDAMRQARAKAIAAARPIWAQIKATQLNQKAQYQSFMQNVPQNPCTGCSDSNCNDKFADQTAQSNKASNRCCDSQECSDRFKNEILAKQPAHSIVTPPPSLPTVPTTLPSVDPTASVDPMETDPPLIPSYPEDAVLAYSGLKGAFMAGKAMCFPGETPICISETESRPIKDIQEGEEVESCRAESGSNLGKCEFRKVQHVIKDTAYHLVKLYFGEKSLRATEEHPFYVAKQNDWVEARRLQINDELVTLKGETIAIDKIEDEYGTFDVYNLEVEDNHTYYACGVSDKDSDDRLGVLVHNCNVVAATVTSSTVRSGVSTIAKGTYGIAKGSLGYLKAAPGAIKSGVVYTYNTAKHYLGRGWTAARNYWRGADSAGGKVADKVLEGAEKLPNRRNHFTDQFQKQGGVEQAQKDFKELANKGSIEQIQGKPEGWLKGKTADGSNVMVRPDSSGGKPTIQIDKPDGHTIKIRY